MKRLTLILPIFLSLIGCTVNPPTLDATHFKKTTVIRDNPSENLITFSTVKGFQKKPVAIGEMWNDNFLRGFINKNTGERGYQAYNVVYYGASGTKATWKHFNRAYYDGFGGTVSIPTKILKTDENCAALTVYGQCIYGEHVTFRVDQEFLKILTIKATKDWQYTLVSEGGEFHQEMITRAEIAGLLASMDEYPLAKMPTATRPTRDLLDEPEPFIPPPPAIPALPP